MMATRWAPAASRCRTGGATARTAARAPCPVSAAARAGAIRWGGAYGHSWAIDPSTETTHLLLTNTAFEGMNGPLSREIERAVHA